MKHFNLSCKAILLIVIASVLFGYGCNPDNKNRYEDPPWLGGSSIETLEKRGNFKIFLELMDSAKYREPITKQLFTLFVPNDDAFKAYFKERGISSVADLSQDEAVQLFTLHVLRNPRSRYQLIYEFAWNEEQGPNGEYASIFNRKVTASTSIPYTEVPKYAPKDKVGKELLIYTDPKSVPVWSSDYLEDFFSAPDGSDYKLLYPNSTWGGSLQWHNAQVIEEEARTASGFINFLDQVVAPMPSIEEYLIAHKETHGLFYDLCQRFANYTGQKFDKQKRVEFLKTYDQIFNFANENVTVGTVPNGMKTYVTMFAPSNKVLQDYLDRTVLKYYPSIDSVPQITLFYILQSQLSQSLCLASKIARSYFNPFGDAMTIPTSDINKAYMCSNGAFYDMKKVLEPNVFTCVPGRLYLDKNFSTFVNAINVAGLIGSITDPNINVTLFAPNNDQMDAYNIRYDAIKDVILTIVDGSWAEMKEDDLITFIQDHIYIGKLDDLSGDGFIEMASQNFVHYNNNSVSSGENQFMGEEAKVTDKIVSEKNGLLYTINNSIKSDYSMGELLVDNPSLSKFADLLISANMLDPYYVDQISLDTIPTLKFLSEEVYWTAFIPDNNAMTVAQNKGLIPTDPEELKKFLLYHFIRKKTIFDDGLVSGSFNSNRVGEVTTDGVLYSKLEITNSKNSLTVTDNSGQKITVDHKNANRLVTKGVVHTITSVLKY